MTNFKNLTPKHFEVETVGKGAVVSPLKLSKKDGDGLFQYVDDSDRILYHTSLKYYNKCRKSEEPPITFEKAGPREFLYFEPAKTKVAIVTCGGLCPGLNDVIRSLVMTLWHRYDVQRILGIQYGFAGFIPGNNYPYIELNPEVVSQIHLYGGTFLGSSRGQQDIGVIVDSLEMMNINILFTIGGDGTLKGAHAIKEEIKKRNLNIAVGAIPKTIDNDINFIEKSFGFETAFSIANEIVRDAHNEAKGAPNGIALVKLMGRDSGFIAANAAIAIQEVNFVLVPEMKFDLYGKNGFLEALRKRLELRKHALIIVAEGTGQYFFNDEEIERDASGNVRYRDIGVFLRDKIDEEFKKQDFPVSIKYIDPSYIVRSTRANANDSKFCSQLAHNAVHAAMAGKTDFVVGNWNGHFTLLPIPVTVHFRKRIDLESELWYTVIEGTGQPISMLNEETDREVPR